MCFIHMFSYRRVVDGERSSQPLSLHPSMASLIVVRSLQRQPEDGRSGNRLRFLGLGHQSGQFALGGPLAAPEGQVAVTYLSGVWSRPRKTAQFHTFGCRWRRLPGIGPSTPSRNCWASCWV